LLSLGTPNGLEGASPRKTDSHFNCVANPGFEFVQRATPAGWKLTRNEGFSLSGQAHSGRCCIALGSPQGEWPLIEQEVRLLPDRDYVLSFWFRSEGDGRGNLTVNLMGTGWGADFKASPSTEWKRSCYLFTPKVPSVKLQFHNYHRKGMTFFVDDVSIDTNFAAIVELLRPVLERTPVVNNTPTFKWRPAIDKKYLSFDLLLSRSMRFPPERTLVFSDLLEEVESTPFEPLADGKWFWKVRFQYNNLTTNATGSGESEVAAVTVKSDGEDYRAPRIASFGPMRIEDPAAAEICVRYEDNPQGSGIDHGGVALKIDGEDVTPQCDVTDGAIVYRPPKIEEAVHTGEVTVADRNGNTTVKRWWFLVKPKPTEGIVSWDNEKKIFLVDGKPFFPFGMYQYRLGGPKEPDRFKVYRSWGFNTTQFYDGEPIPGVKEASAAGLKVFAVHPYDGGTQNEWNLYNENVPFDDPTVAPIIAQRIFEGCNEPALFAWSIRDEPDKGPIPRTRLRTLHEFIKGLDPYHLTDVVLIKYGAYYAYAGVADLIVGDVYPYNASAGTGNGDRIWDEPIHQDRAQGGNRPVLTILQHFGGAKGTSWPHVVPNEDRRFMAYLAYIHGTRGIMWYAYEHGPYHSENHPEQWESLKKLAKEFETMSPVLLSDDASEKVLMRVTAPLDKQDRAGNPAVHYLMKDHGGRRYLITVNAAREPVQAVFRIDAAVQSIKEKPEGRPVPIVRRSDFADSYQPFGVHIYEIELK